jgi:hypothetical protein
MLEVDAFDRKECFFWGTGNEGEEKYSQALSSRSALRTPELDSNIPNGPQFSRLLMPSWGQK